MSKGNGSQIRGFGEYLALQSCLVLLLVVPMLASLLMKRTTPGLSITPWDFAYCAFVLLVFAIGEQAMWSLLRRGYARRYIPKREPRV